MIRTTTIFPGKHLSPTTKPSTTRKDAGDDNPLVEGSK